MKYLMTGWESVKFLPFLGLVLIEVDNVTGGPCFREELASLKAF